MAIERLRDVRNEFADRIRSSFEDKAKPCSICEKPGSCCLDEHFVNVRISRLEASAIRRRLDELDGEVRRKVDARINESIKKYRLDETGASSNRTYSCPLFERSVGCLVHTKAKPLPCIAHACYESGEDLPPDELLAEAETAVASLNRRAYGKALPLQPIPVAIARKTLSGF